MSLWFCYSCKQIYHSSANWLRCPDCHSAGALVRHHLPGAPPIEPGDGVVVIHEPGCCEHGDPPKPPAEPTATGDA